MIEHKSMESKITQNELYDFATKIWPYNRSLTGSGVRETLQAIKLEVPTLKTRSFSSGLKVFDWEIPMEWNVIYAYIIDPNGNKICDFSTNNLHLVGYSESIEVDLQLSDLQDHLYSLPEQPDAIPYVTSYYEQRWGFCISERQRQKLLEGTYKIRISTSKTIGTLDIGEIFIPGVDKKEIFLSTYVCHPSMANNEISGITVSTFIAKYLAKRTNLRHSYRFVFLPETIGSITYIHHNLKKMKKNIIAGFNLTCIGDERNYSYLPSRNGDVLSDRAALHVLENQYQGYKKYSWLDRGSDERQYCAPGIDLPIASLMRTKYGEYPEYHTSLDDLINVVTAKGLMGGFDLVRKVIEVLEMDIIARPKMLCEPMMSKRHLYPTLSTKNLHSDIRLRMNIISYLDGKKSLLDIANILGKPIELVYNEMLTLKEMGVVDF
jgi:aminopeptidase-like protein